MINTEHFTFYISYAKAADRLYNKGKYREYALLMKAITDFGLYGVIPDDDSEVWDLASFDLILTNITSTLDKQTPKKGAGRPEIELDYEEVAEAYYRLGTWKATAQELGVCENKLRDWRYYHKFDENGKNSKIMAKTQKVFEEMAETQKLNGKNSKIMAKTQKVFEENSDIFEENWQEIALKDQDGKNSKIMAKMAKTQKYKIKDKIKNKDKEKEEEQVEVQDKEKEKVNDEEKQQDMLVEQGEQTMAKKEYKYKRGVISNSGEVFWMTYEEAKAKLGPGPNLEYYWSRAKLTEEEKQADAAAEVAEMCAEPAPKDWRDKAIELGF